MACDSLMLYLKLIFVSMFKLTLVSLLLLLCIVNQTAAQAGDRTAFNAAYKSYEAAVDQQDWRLALKHALRSYELGPSLYDSKHEYRIALAQNLGLVYAKLYSDKSKLYLGEALDLAEGIHGKKSPKLIDLLTDLGTAHIRAYRKGPEQRYFKRALNISKATYGEESRDYGLLNSNIGNLITQKARTRDGRRYLVRGLEILERVTGKDSRSYGVAAFLRGKYELSTNDYKKAVTLFNDTLHVFEREGEPADQVALSTHAFLVQAYEKLDQTELATTHCLAIGKMTPTRDKQDFLPIYRAAPSYPRTAAERSLEGHVDLAFVVDKAGFVKSPRILSNKGHASFRRSALKAVKGYRYAPAFDKGKPIATQDVEIRVSYEMAD